jgi:chorismate mutase
MGPETQDVTLEDLRTEIDQLQEQIQELTNHRDQHKEMLVRLWNAHLAQETEVTALTDTTPVWTERINLDSTIKDGYRVKEVTITVQYSEEERPAREERRKRLMEAIADGQIAADRMNHERTHQQRFS